MAKRKGNLTFRLSDYDREVLQLIADREMRPLSNQINFFIKQSVDAYLNSNSLTVEEVKDPHTEEVEGLTLVKFPF